MFYLQKSFMFKTIFNGANINIAKSITPVVFTAGTKKNLRILGT